MAVGHIFAARRRFRAGLLCAVVAAVLGTTSAFPAFGAGGPSRATDRVNRAHLHRQLRVDLEKYLHAYGKTEHISAGAVTVSTPGKRSPVSAAAGTTRFGGSRPVGPHSVWQIGSNTKAFTSVLLLQLEAKKRLSIHDTLGKWLPQYPRWRNVTIKSLLDMTSGIPDFTDQRAFWSAFASHPYRNFTGRQLVSYALRGTPTTGYSYSNTNYILAQMIIARAGRRPYRQQLENRIIKPLQLHGLRYRTNFYSAAVTAREPAGYFADRQQFPELSRFGHRDVAQYTLSWARGAGGIVSTTRGMTVWERALYSGRLLPAEQQHQLLSLVSTTSGKPIRRTSPKNPDGYGLGVGQQTNSVFGRYWFYEGSTLGFRALHFYFPKSGVIMAMALNSATDQDHISVLGFLAHNTLTCDHIITGNCASEDPLRARQTERQEGSSWSTGTGRTIGG
jgi:D-alanyl-D-alanine carboxypeptidase